MKNYLCFCNRIVLKEIKHTKKTVLQQIGLYFYKGLSVKYAWTEHSEAN